jgi:hypothetical protein
VPGLKKEYRAIPLLPLWAFVACSRENFTFYTYLFDMIPPEDDP